MTTPPSPGSAYQYTTLAAPSDSKHEFRLLRLLPGDEGTVIRCELEVADLDDASPYEALSYTWGDPKGPECDIPCRGDLEADYYIKVHEKDFRVGYNLISALQHLRLETSPRTMWIDAICINQADNQEKSFQVQAMDKIYTRAIKVLAWLGEEDDFTNLAFDTIEEVCWAKKAKFWRYCSRVLEKPMAEVTRIDFDNICTSAETRDKSTVEIGDPLTDIIVVNLASRRFFLDAMWSAPPMNGIAYDDSLEAMALAIFGPSRHLARQLVNHPEETFLGKVASDALSALTQTFNSRTYYSRLWIVQELHLAQDVSIVCGRRHLNLDAFTTSLLAFCTLDDHHATDAAERLRETELLEHIAGASDFSSFRLVRFGGFGDSVLQPLHFWLSELSTKQCVDRRDSIFALIGISSPINIPIDYTRSTEEIFARATKTIINQNKSLDSIIGYERGTLPTKLQDRPGYQTWVPEWDRPYLKFNNSMRQPFYNCGGALETEYNENDDLFSLAIDGYFCGQLRSSFSINADKANRDTVWKVALDLQDTLRLDRKQRRYGFSWRGHFALHSSPRHTFSQDQIFWRTLVKDAYEIDVYSDYFDNDIAYRTKQGLELEEAFTNDIQQALESSPSKILLKRLHYCMGTHQFCMTSDNKIALVYGGGQEDDKVFLAKGASVPLILRPIKRPRQGLFRTRAKQVEYALVGSAFIYEYMDGGPFQELEDSKRPRDKVLLV